MSGVGCGDDDRHIHGQSLGGQDHVGIEGGIGRGWLTGAPCLRPQLRCAPHGVRSQGKVFKECTEPIQIGKGGVALNSDQFPSDFIIGNLRNDHSPADSTKRREPRPTCEWLRAVIWVRHESQWPGIENDSRAQGARPSSRSANSNRSPAAFLFALSARHRS